MQGNLMFYLIIFKKRFNIVYLLSTIKFVSAVKLIELILNHLVYYDIKLDYNAL